MHFENISVYEWMYTWTYIDVFLSTHTNTYEICFYIYKSIYVDQNSFRIINTSVPQKLGLN